ncbi:MAG: FtsX-like permease family protein [bacterium]|nr:FtsX-like permease family protein [bacterium]
MLLNYVKIAFRNIKRHKIYSFVNIFGLSLGIGCCILIFLYVLDELSYDRFHDNSGRIYRLLEEIQLRNRKYTPAAVSAPVGPAMFDEYPEIIKSVRLFRLPNEIKTVIQTDENRFEEEGLLFADSTFFEIFNFSFLEGSPRTALIDPNSVIITEEIAEKYFGEEDPINKRIRIKNTLDLTVSGVLRNTPENSHFSFSFLLPIERVGDIYDPFSLTDWQENSYYTYFLLDENADANALEEKFDDFIKQHQHRGERTEDFVEYRLQPLVDIHLHSNLVRELESNSLVKYVYIFSSISLIILITASFNFMNLSTARSSIRAKEVGIRKVVGAKRKQLISQFLGESVILSLLAFIMALGIIALLLPFFNSITFKQLTVGYRTEIWKLYIILGTSALIGMGSGSYPALFLSSFKPSKVLKGTLSTRSTKTIFRTSLVVLQFGISILLIIGTFVIYSQLNYIKNKDLGYDHEGILAIKLKSGAENYVSLKNEFLGHANVIDVTASSELPVNVLNETTVEWYGSNYDEPPFFRYISVDYNFLSMYKFKLKEGRGFSEYITSDVDKSVILNEIAVTQIGSDSLLDSRLNIEFEDKKALVVGIVEDFHLGSLYEPMEPVVIFPGDISNFNWISVKIMPRNIDDTVSYLKDAAERVMPDQAFEYFFIDDYLDNIYRNEKIMGQIFVIFSMFTVLIACLGLFGLVSFTAEERTHEIGVRKILGATVPNIVSLLLKDFARLILVANIVSWPLGYFLMDRWLRDFAYRVDIDLNVFLFACITTYIIALITVSFQTIKAAIANPADSLRYE